VSYLKGTPTFIGLYRALVFYYLIVLLFNCSIVLLFYYPIIPLSNYVVFNYIFSYLAKDNNNTPIIQ